MEEKEGNAETNNSRVFLAEMIVQKKLIQPVEKPAGIYFIKMPAMHLPAGQKKDKDLLETHTLATAGHCKCEFYKHNRSYIHTIAAQLFETGTISQDHVKNVSKIERAFKSRPKSGTKGPDEVEEVDKRPKKKRPNIDEPPLDDLAYFMSSPDPADFEFIAKVLRILLLHADQYQFG